MIVWSIIHIIDIVLWLVMAVSVFYVLFFALASLLPKNLTPHPSSPSTFLILFPAYHEDSVIRTSVETFLKQDYPRDLYQLVVISDHETDETNAWLASQPLTLLTPTFEKSSKAKALQFAIHQVQPSNLNPQTSNLKSHVVILDADNIVAPGFLSRLNAECQKGYRAIQCHRTAKNADNDIAALDGLSEEINNSIFRRGHNRVGLSSALIGSGMCFDYSWFSDNVDHLDSAVEDRELEALLLRQDIYIHYAEDILVMDEKVSSSDNFQRQRLRWMTGQVQALFRMAPHLLKAFATGNINYIDKTLQQALIPRSILIMTVPLFALLATLFTPHSPLLTPHSSLIRWWLLVVALAVGLFVAIPPQLRTRAIFTKAAALPGMVLRMVRNIFHIECKNTEFIHTTHDK